MKKRKQGVAVTGAGFCGSTLTAQMISACRQRQVASQTALSRPVQILLSFDQMSSVLLKSELRSDSGASIPEWPRFSPLQVCV